MSINDFCDNFLIKCLNKIARLDKTCILMGDFNTDLLKSHESNVTSKFLEVMTYYFFYLLYSVTYTCCCFFHNTNRQYFHEFVEFVTVPGNLLCQLAEHLLQLFVLKDFRVCYRSKHKQIFKLNYRLFNKNEFKNEINQIDWKTLFDSHVMNLCFEKFLHILT